MSDRRYERSRFPLCVGSLNSTAADRSAMPSSVAEACLQPFASPRLSHPPRKGSWHDMHNTFRTRRSHIGCTRLLCCSFFRGNSGPRISRIGANSWMLSRQSDPNRTSPARPRKRGCWSWKSFAATTACARPHRERAKRIRRAHPMGRCTPIAVWRMRSWRFTGKSRDRLAESVQASWPPAGQPQSPSCRPTVWRERSEHPPRRSFTTGWLHCQRSRPYA